MPSTFLWHYWESCLVQNGQAIKHVARQLSLTLTGWPSHSWAVWRSQAIKRVDQLVLGTPKFGILLIFHDTWVTARRALPCRRADGARVGRSLADRAAGGIRDWWDSKAKISRQRNVWGEVVFAFCKLKKKEVNFYTAKTSRLSNERNCKWDLNRSNDQRSTVRSSTRTKSIAFGFMKHFPHWLKILHQNPQTEGNLAESSSIPGARTHSVLHSRTDFAQTSGVVWPPRLGNPPHSTVKSGSNTVQHFLRESPL